MIREIQEMREAAVRFLYCEECYRIFKIGTIVFLFIVGVVCLVLL